MLCHVKFTLCFVIYKNVNKIRKVKCPVLVIHGIEDDVVNWLHGNGLWKMARELYEPLWIKGGGHCNWEIYPGYICHLCRFIQEMENIITTTRLKKEIRESLGLHKRSNTSTAISTKWCCRIKLRRPKCPAYWKPSCPKCWLDPYPTLSPYPNAPHLAWSPLAHIPNDPYPYILIFIYLFKFFIFDIKV